MGVLSCWTLGILLSPLHNNEVVSPRIFGACRLFIEQYMACRGNDSLEESIYVIASSEGIALV